MLRTLLLVTSLVFTAGQAQAQFSCTQASIGAGCGPQLTITASPNGMSSERITFAGSGLFPREGGIFIVGQQEFMVPVPGTGCFLYTDFVWGHTFQANAAGEWRQPRAWPHSVTATLRVQLGTFRVGMNGMLEILLSNARRISCGP